MKFFMFSSILIATSAVAEQRIQGIAVGDGSVDGQRVQAYEKTWQQCSLQDGKWVSGGTVTELVTVIGDHLRLRQSSERPDGIRSVATTYFVHASLSPLRMELEAVDPDGNTLISSVHELAPDGYSGRVARRGQDEQAVDGTISSGMYHGGVLGLPLATLDFAKANYELDASMMMFDAHYKVIATSAGMEEIEHGGTTVTARMVDVEWHHDNGDIYPPGPDASGGRYWLLVDRSDDLPLVLRYKTDAYAVEFLPMSCP